MQFTAITFPLQQTPDIISHIQLSPNCGLSAHLAHTLLHEPIAHFFPGLSSSPFPMLSVQTLKPVLDSAPGPWHGLNSQPFIEFISSPSPTTPSLSHRPRRGCSLGLLLLLWRCCYAFDSLPGEGGTSCPALTDSRGAPEYWTVRCPNLRL